MREHTTSRRRLQPSVPVLSILVILSTGTTAGCFDAFGQPSAVLATTGPAACDVFTLFVDLAPSFWESREGGVTVELSEFNGEDFEPLIYRRRPARTGPAAFEQRLGDHARSGHGEADFVVGQDVGVRVNDEGGGPSVGPPWFYHITCETQHELGEAAGTQPFSQKARAPREVIATGFVPVDTRSNNA